MPRDLVAEGLQAGVASLGLVPVSTTDPHGSELLSITKSEARFTRLQCNIGVAAKLHNMDFQGSRVNVVMVTLTYADKDGWKPSQMSAYLHAVRQWFKRVTKGRALRYVWVGENQDGTHRDDGQARNVIHYHVIFWMPKGIFMPKADKRGWWPHGMTKTERALKPVGYLISYVKKMASKDGIPKGARIYGVGGLPPQSRCVRRWINYPQFIKHRTDVHCRWGRAKGGGWVNHRTGEWFPSEYGLSFSTPSTTYVVRLHDHGRPMGQTPGPFSFLPARGGVQEAS